MVLVYKCEFCGSKNQEEVFDRGIVLSSCKDCQQRFAIEVRRTHLKNSSDLTSR